jgi:hypothetical protein
MDMKNNVIRVLFVPIFAVSFATRAEASPWWWPSKTPVKTVQVSLPANNGGMISVTIPTKSTSVKQGTQGNQGIQSIGFRPAGGSTKNRLDDERIAADIARHF